MFSLGSLPIIVQVFDIVAVCAAFVYIFLAHKSWLLPGKKQMDEAERDAAISAVGTFLTVNVAAASVLLAGVGVTAGLRFGDRPLPQEAFTQLTLAAVWLVAALILGSATAAYVVSHVHHSRSVAENPLITTTATAQLVSTWGGALFFLTAFFLF